MSSSTEPTSLKDFQDPDDTEQTEAEIPPAEERSGILGIDMPDARDEKPSTLLGYAFQIQAARTRPIPDDEEYPAYRGRLERNGCSRYLGEEQQWRHNGEYHADDREENTWHEHFVSVDIRE